MSDEDLRRAIEFLVEQQSRYSTRLDRDESRLTQLEDSFRTLVELARVTDDRIDHLDEAITTLSNTIGNLVKSMIALAESQLQSDAKLAQLAESQVRSDAKLVQLAEAQGRSEAKVAESQARADAKFADLAQAQAWADEKLGQLAEAQMKTDARVNRLIDTDDRSIDAH